MRIRSLGRAPQSPGMGWGYSVIHCIGGRRHMLGQSVNWDFQWSQIVGRAWADDDFKQRLLADPAGVLAGYDLAPPAGLRIEVYEEPAWVPPGTDGVLHLVLPVKPSDDE